MDVHKQHPAGMTPDRYAELTRILEERRREIMDQVQEKIRDVRTESPNSPTHGVLDAAALRDRVLAETRAMRSL